MTEDDELDERLRRLFDDDGLILPVARDAERAVVAGARHRRRHRLSAAAAGGVVAVAGLVFAAAALAGVGRTGGGVLAASRPPASSPTLTASQEPTTTAVPRTARGVLGPFGADGVWLGMPARLAVRLAVGKSPLPTTPGMPGCVGYAIFVPTPTPTATVSSVPVGKPGVITVVISPRQGVVELGGVTALRTPEGIRLGMSAKQVYATYRKVAYPARLPATLLAGVPGNVAAAYMFNVDSDGIVRSIWLRAEGDPHC